MVRPSRMRWLLALVLLLGLLTRVLPHLHNRSLRMDEAAVALNVLERSPAGLLAPLDHDQAAPIGFLGMVKLAAWGLGSGERALRVPPLLMGLAALFLFGVLAVRCLQGREAIVAILLCACSASLVYYSSDLKPYSGDAAWAATLLLVTLEALRRPGIRPLLLLAGLGLIGLLFSFPTVFVLGGAVIALAFRARSAGRRRYAAVAALALLWGGAWLASYQLFLHPVAGRPCFVEYWAPTFLSWPLTAGGLVRWIGFCLAELVNGAGVATSMTHWHHGPVGTALTTVALSLLCAGGVSVGRRDKALLLLLTTPVLLALVAAGLGRYPFFGRLLIFTSPSVLVLMAEGLSWLWRLRPALGPVAAGVSLVLLTFLPLGRGVLGMFHPLLMEEIRPVLAFVQRHLEKGDTLYVYHDGQRAFAYYHRHHGGFPLTGARVVYGSGRAASVATHAAELGALGPLPRLWLVLSHTVYYRKGGRDDHPLYRSLLELAGTRGIGMKTRGAAAYLYDLSGRSQR